MTYEPIFKGQWPTTAADRWTLIRRFLSVWCFGNNDQCLTPSNLAGPYKSKLQQCTTSSISPSLQHWSDVVENYGREHLVIRDILDVSDLSSHIEVPAGEFTVILMQGEGDVFWAVRNDSLSDDDPQIFTFQDYDNDSPSLLGTYPSASSFALWYFCLYNTIGRNRVDAFCYDFSSEAYPEISGWFSHRLWVQQSNPFCCSLEILEAKNCVGIRENNRLTCSLFVDHTQLNLPNILSEALEEQHHHRKELRKLLGKSDDETST